jgi:hypothetical protein
MFFSGTAGLPSARGQSVIAGDLAVCDTDFSALCSKTNFPGVFQATLHLSLIAAVKPAVMVKAAMLVHLFKSSFLTTRSGNASLINLAATCLCSSRRC